MSAPHTFPDGTEWVDVVAALRKLIAEGRGDEQVKLTARDRQLDGPAHEVCSTLLDMTRDMTRQELAKNRTFLTQVAEVRQENPPGQLLAALQVQLEKIAPTAVAMRRELLVAGEQEFAAELEELDDQIARMAALIQEPVEQTQGGAGKVRVLDEHRVARDAHEIRDFPLRDKIARMNRLADGGNAEGWQAINEDAKGMIEQMTGKPLVQAIEMVLDESFPELMKAFYPRVYESTGRYHSPRTCAVMMANVVAEMLRYGYHRSATAYRLLAPGLAYLRERRMPMFFLAPDLLEAVLRTDFDDDINWVEMSLPYETGVLILPKGALVHPTDGDVSMLVWSRMRAGDHPSPWPGVPSSIFANDSFVIMGACPQTMIWYDSILTANVRPVMRLNNLFYREPGEQVPPIRKSNVMDSDLTEQDSAFVEKLGVIVFGTLLAMNARPLLVEHGKLIKRVGKGEKAREFWSPNVIGARYKFKREVPRVVSGQFVYAGRESGSHASPRMHWRRGHYRNQPVGHQRKERKTIWIEPCLIGAEA